MNMKYILGAAAMLPLLPLMYIQAKRIKASVPRLPPAKGPEGKCFVKPVSSQTLKIMAIGESTIAGVGVATHEEGFTGTLAKEISKLFQIQVDWKVYARSGFTTKRVTDVIIPSIQEQDVGLIVVGLGGNDAFTLSSPKKWRQDISNLIAVLRVKFPDSLILFCNMPPIKLFPAFTSLIKFTIGNLVELFGEELNNLVKQYNGVYFSDEVITLKGWLTKYSIEGKESDFFSDGVHPSKLTYQTWAKDLASFLWITPEIKTVLSRLNH